MSEPTKGAPPTPLRRRGRSAWRQQIDTCAEMAEADRGEWYSIPMPAVGGSNTRALIRNAITDIIAETSVNGGRVWIRFR